MMILTHDSNNTHLAWIIFLFWGVLILSACTIQTEQTTAATPVVATNEPLATAIVTQPALTATSILEKPPSTAELTPVTTHTPVKPTPSATLSEDAGFFNPQCDRQPQAILSTQPHEETGEAWHLYTNEIYGFSFTFPPEWELVEGQNYLCLNYKPKRDIKFVVGFKWADNDHISIVRTGVAATDEIVTSEVNFIGQSIDRNVFRYEGKNKAILYNNAFHIRANAVLFTLSVDDYSSPYETAELPSQVMQSADAIVKSFQLAEE